jgi:2-polyprenyl-3-methyl-5-hydroxy-6-metoxy-1,4-benzoquinol methylase
MWYCGGYTLPPEGAIRNRRPNLCLIRCVANCRDVAQLQKSIRKSLIEGEGKPDNAMRLDTRLERTVEKRGRSTAGLYPGEKGMSNSSSENIRAREAWDANARFWDERMAEGNDFFISLIWPSVEKLLRPLPGENFLDIACGNGLTSRRLAHAGADVVAFDFSEEMIRLARIRPYNSQGISQGDGNIDYRVVDATDADALHSLGSRTFDGALCNMALMDMSDIRPLMNAVASLLRPGGRFVFSTIHPCFNNPAVVQMGELQDREGALVITYSVKVSRYLTPYTQAGLAMNGQPVPHPYFHRPLGMLLQEMFDAGFALDALEERAFSPEVPAGSSPFSWSGRFSEIPPVLVGRLRPQTIA